MSCVPFLPPTRSVNLVTLKLFAFLFLMFDFDHETNSIVVKRKKRDENEEELYMCVNLSTNSEIIGDLEYEIDEERFIR